MSNRIITFVIIVFLLSATIGVFLYTKSFKNSPSPSFQPVSKVNQKPLPARDNPVTNVGATVTEAETKPAVPTNQPTSDLPDSYNLAVPFTPQAPSANWDELHNEACEEAAAIMASAYLSGDAREKIPASEVEEEIAKLTNWQEKTFGYFLDSTVAETAQMIREVYGLKAEIVSNFTKSDIKKAIVAKSVVIVSVNGQKIGNPYYQQPGPIYHMLVIRGYTGDRLVTNDPGTRRGQNYSYDYSTIKNATADWDHALNTIDEAKSVMIVISK